jgi:hypothetical protein
MMLIATPSAASSFEVLLTSFSLDKWITDYLKTLFTNMPVDIKKFKSNFKNFDEKKLAANFNLILSFFAQIGV